MALLKSVKRKSKKRSARKKKSNVKRRSILRKSIKKRSIRKSIKKRSIRKSIKNVKNVKNVKYRFYSENNENNENKKNEWVNIIKELQMSNQLETFIINFIQKYYDEIIEWQKYMLELRESNKTNMIRFLFDYIDKLKLEEALPDGERETGFFDKASLVSTVMGKIMDFSKIMSMSEEKEKNDAVSKWIDRLQDHIFKSQTLWSILNEWVDYYDKMDKKLPKNIQISNMIKWIITEMWKRDDLITEILKEVKDDPELSNGYNNNEIIKQIVLNIIEIWDQRRIFIKFILTSKGSLREKIITLMEKDFEKKSRESVYDQEYQTYKKSVKERKKDFKELYLKLIDDSRSKQKNCREKYEKCSYIRDRDERDLCLSKNKVGECQKEIIAKREKRLNKMKKIMEEDKKSYQPVQETLAKLCEINPYERKCVSEYESPFDDYDFELLESYSKNAHEEYKIQKKRKEDFEKQDGTEQNEKLKEKEKIKKEKEENRRKKAKEMEARQKLEAMQMINSIFS